MYSLALGDAIRAGTFYQGTEAAIEVGHVVEEYLRHEGRLVTDRVCNGVVPVVGVDLHGLHDPV